MNIRLQKLNYKLMIKMLKYFISPNADEKINIHYQLGSFQITREPHFERSQTVAEPLINDIV